MWDVVTLVVPNDFFVMTIMDRKIRIIDARNKEKFQVDDAYLNGYARLCGIHATGVYMVLCRHVDSATQECFPSKDLIAEKLGLSVSSVYRGIKILEKHGIIYVEKQGRKKGGAFNVQHYILLDKSMWIKPSVTGTVGQKTTSPSVTQTKNRRSQGPNKDTQSKDTQLRREKLNQLRQQLIDKTIIH